MKIFVKAKTVRTFKLEIAPSKGQAFTILFNLGQYKS